MMTCMLNLFRSACHRYYSLLRGNYSEMTIVTQLALNELIPTFEHSVRARRAPRAFAVVAQE